MQTGPFSKKRGVFIDVTEGVSAQSSLTETEQKQFEKLDIAYRALVAILYNYVPTSGHPGGSISSGRIVEHLLYKDMAYELARPHRNDADIVSYAAGHKALGLYAMWALRNECVRISQPALLAQAEKDQLRLEDLLGFRHNKVHGTPLFQKYHVKPLGGHPEPLVPFVRTSTGASGVGDGSAVGLAFGAADTYGENCPRVHILEGEGGLTAGRVSEAAAMAATAQLKNVVFHIDWNEASIESERVTSEGEHPGDYVQWNPCEFFYIHDFNVIYVPNGHDFNQIHAAQAQVSQLNNHQPTAIIYRTVKGWKYGLEGKASHGSGHKFASPEFYQALAEFEQTFGVSFPHFEGDKTPENIEKFYWETLLTVRRALEQEKTLAAFVSGQIKERVDTLNRLQRVEREGLGNCEDLYTQFSPNKVPAEFVFEKGKAYTTRGVLGGVLNYLNKQTNGTILVGSADLYGSTGAGAIAKGFASGSFNMKSNPLSRQLSAGGICEDGMAAVCSGISSFGKQVGVASSYGAFVAFEHVAARLHAIGVQAAREVGQHPNTFILFNGHASLPTGEDGPTHADPQSLQLLQDNFPKGACITITPLEVDEIWPLVTVSLSKRPAVFAPFVVRPSYNFLDRSALGMDPAAQAVKGIYYIRRAHGKSEGTVIVQGTGVGRQVAALLPQLNANGPDIDIVYVTSRELFELLPQDEQETLLPLATRHRAMGITDFTLPTLEPWLLSQAGRQHTLFPHKNGVFLGSGTASKVYEEAGLNSEAILQAVQAYVQDLKKGAAWL